MNDLNHTDNAMVISNTDKASSGNKFQNTVFDRIHQILDDTAIMKNKVLYNDVEIVYRKKKTESDIEITFPAKSRFKVIFETTKTMRNDRDNDKDVKAQAIINFHKKHNIEVIYAVVVKNDEDYTGSNTRNEININNKIAHEINEERQITAERDDCVHLFLREDEAYDCIEYIKNNLHKDRLTLINECREIIKNNKITKRKFEEEPQQLSFFNIM